MRTPRPARPYLPALATALGAALAATDARADSGLFNVHLEAAFNSVLYGGAMIAPLGMGFATGADGQLAVDLQFAPPVAIEATGGLGWLNSLDHPWMHTSIGARVRVFDSHDSAPDDPRRPFTANGFVAAHVGYHWFETNQASADVAFGVDAPLFRPFMFESFARVTVLHGFDATALTDLTLQLGIGLTWGLGIFAEVDSDHDGLSDNRERHVTHTDPNRADTDGDGVPDGTEVRLHTDPNDRDTNHDGVPDGAQGTVHEASGEPGPGPPPELDSDGDGVPDDRDVCLDTPPRTHVDDRGCTTP